MDGFSKAIPKINEGRNQQHGFGPPHARGVTAERQERKD